MPSKYEKYRTGIKNVPTVPESTTELEKFDWFKFKSTAPEKVYMPEHVSVINAGTETPEQRKMRMLRQLSLTCTACSMCELGLQGAIRNDEIRDPHVFSNMNPVRFMIVLSNDLQWTELYSRKPTLDNEILAELTKYNLSEDMFYICRTVRCYGNINSEHFMKCSTFLQMECNLLKPILVIVFHETAFTFLCPNGSFTKFAVVKSNFGVNVLPISSLDQIKPLNKLICKLQSKTNIIPKQK